MLSALLWGDACHACKLDTPASHSTLTGPSSWTAGPTGHFWHRFLEKRVWKSSPKSNKAVFSKLALDQVHEHVAVVKQVVS